MGSNPLLFGKNLSATKPLTITPEAGIGNVITQEIVRHFIEAIQFQFSQAVVFNRLATEIGLVVMQKNFQTMRAPSVFAHNLRTGLVEYAFYGIEMNRQSIRVAMKTTISQDFGGFCIVAMDRYELGLGSSDESYQSA